MRYFKRHIRISILTTKALTGKFTWKQLTSIALSMGVSDSTAKSYIDEVELRLKSRGLLF